MWIVVAMALLGCGDDAAPEQITREVREVTQPVLPPLPSHPIEVTPPPITATGPAYTVGLAADGPAHRAFVLGPDGAELGRWPLPPDLTPESLAPVIAVVPPGARVSIAADQSIRYASVVALMDALRRRGVAHMALAVEPVAPPAPAP